MSSSGLIFCILFSLVAHRASAQVLRPRVVTPIVWGESRDLRCEYLMNPDRVTRVLLWLSDEDATIPEIKLALIHLQNWLQQSPDSSDLIKRLAQTSLSSTARAIMQKRADPKLTLFKN